MFGSAVCDKLQNTEKKRVILASVKLGAPSCPWLTEYRLHLPFPCSPAFAALSEDAIALLHQAVLDKHQGTLVPTPAEFPEEVWHRNLSTCPNDRDLKKAQIFLEEILEDYFTEEGLPKRAGSVYQCIG